MAASPIINSFPINNIVPQVNQTHVFQNPAQIPHQMPIIQKQTVPNPVFIQQQPVENGVNNVNERGFYGNLEQQQAPPQNGVNIVQETPPQATENSGNYHIIHEVGSNHNFTPVLEVSDQAQIIQAQILEPENNG